MDQFYFGYGSNLDETDLTDWGFPKHAMEPVGRAIILDRELAFTRYSDNRKGGVLDVRPRTGSVAPGVLFHVRNGGAWSALDDKEGAPKAYRRFLTKAFLEDGRALGAVSYEVLNRKEHVVPSPTYLPVVERGFRAHGLDLATLRAAAENRPAHSAVHAVFVYGTLMRGESRFETLSSRSGGLTDVIPARVTGTLYVNDAFPMVCPAEDASHVVRGELMLVNDIAGLLPVLDRIEGVDGNDGNGLYERRLVTVTLENGEARRAWAYLRPRPLEGAWRAATGSWKKHRGNP